MGLGGWGKGEPGVPRDCGVGPIASLPIPFLQMPLTRQDSARPWRLGGLANGHQGRTGVGPGAREKACLGAPHAALGRV